MKSMSPKNSIGGDQKNAGPRLARVFRASASAPNDKEWMKWPI